MNEQDELSADIWGQKVSLKSQSLNTIICILILVVVCLIGYHGFTHSADSKDAAKEFVSAIKENTQAIRQGNCLAEFPPEKKEAGAALCKRVTQ